MSDYPPRVEKSENIYKLWKSGEGDMDELAVGLYDLTAHYKALHDDYTQLEAELAKEVASREGWRDAWKKSEAESGRLIDENAYLNIKYGQQCKRTVHYMNENAKLKALK